MKKIKIFCSWDLSFDLFHNKQIELYVDRFPIDIVPHNTVRFVLLIEPVDVLNLNSIALERYNLGSYNFLFTHNEDLLRQIPNSFLFEFATTWIREYDFPEKKYEVSTLVGGKIQTTGHKLRQKLWFKENKINNIPTKFFLSGNLGGIENYNSNPILGSDKKPLFDSQFHVCIENCKRNNWFTEKLIDCLQTNTVPIYWGAPNIENWFDIRGFIIVDNLDDIVTACNSLNPSSYQEMLPYIKYNFEKSKKYTTITDRLEEKIIELI